MKTFQVLWTPTPLTLQQDEINGVHLVALIADKVKVIYSGDSQVLADKAYREVFDHYEARRKEEVRDGD